MKAIKAIAQIGIYLNFILVFVSCKLTISYREQTKSALELYKSVVRDSSRVDWALEDFYSNRAKYGKKKYGNSKFFNKAVKNSIRRFAKKQLIGQREKLSLVNSKILSLFKSNFSANDCRIQRDSIVVFTRKIIQPQTAYSHLSSPYKNQSYVFYVFTDYDSITGFGRYLQSDAYYPRDAFSFYPIDFCPYFEDGNTYNKLEFFTGVFYLTHSDLLNKDVICMLGTDNDFNDRKVFSIELDTIPNKLIFTKAFENRLYNFYPIIDGNYSLTQQVLMKPNLKHGIVFMKEAYMNLDKLKGNEAEKTRFNIETSLSNMNLPRDYFYPLMGTTSIAAEDGWAYFGELEDSKYIINETFYIKCEGWGYNFSKEIATFKKLIKLKGKEKKFVSPFDILKMRSEVPHTLDDMKYASTDKTVVGEAKPEERYFLMDFQVVNGKQVWIRIGKKH